MLTEAVKSFVPLLVTAFTTPPIALPNSASAETTKMWSDRIAEINTDPAFQKKMLDGGFAMLDVDSAGMKDFMAARVEEYLKDAREAGLIK